MEFDKITEINVLEKAFNLKNQGINELVWSFNDIDLILNTVEKNDGLIQGGDILTKNNEKFSYSYDSWFYDGKDILESIDHSKDYLIKYCEKNGKDYYFTLVVNWKG